MFRKILMLCPALAFALPIIASSPSMARPLTIEPNPVGWGDQWNQGIDDDLLLAVCVQTQIFVQTGESNRAYDCDTLTGPTCLANCAVADDDATCRSQCDGSGALFCSPAQKTRWGGWGPWGNQGFGPGWGNWDDDDHNFNEDEMLFVDTQTCLELNLASDV
ncbi:hypothetical protein [Nannocystis pusilla]|uniref:Secreted protein n=1 Tax=Nannocystis pusilla TaxID=889268 RepID=A0ABS7TJC7_9BACT|nr:hypothetical protein [Nannocystis pusilla]MBZ5708335.1 hypothetical protein [Nannocystis pusilla]